MKQPAHYIMANKRKGTIYVGVTSNLSRRVYEHKNSINPGFTSKYECKLLVYYEFHDSMTDAFASEKSLKAGSRQKKIDLIESKNPDWRDLYEHIISY